MNRVIPQRTIYLSTEDWRCVVRDVAVNTNGTATITILTKPVEVRLISDGEERYVLADNHPVDVEGFFRENTTDDDRERHPRHIEKGIYWGGCHFCDCEQEAHEYELTTRRITHVVYQEPIGIGDMVSVLGLVADAQTQEDLLLVLERFTGTLEEAKRALAGKPLVKDAIWLEEPDFRKLVEALPPGRKGVSWVDFGGPEDAWAN